jgi:hypothetical protein
MMKAVRIALGVTLGLACTLTSAYADPTSPSNQAQTVNAPVLGKVNLESFIQTLAADGASGSLIDDIIQLITGAQSDECMGCDSNH